MLITVEQCLSEIRTHTEVLAEAATGNLAARIEHCPEWSVADLVWHLTGVHRFWNQVAVEHPVDQPPEIPDAERPADDDLVAGMLTAMETMVTTLGAADQEAACWTWGLQQDVGFITRHQVQEAAVHSWDALDAVGRAGDWSMVEVAATDAVEEFLTHSVANSLWPNPGAEPLDGTLAIGGWQITDGTAAGTLTHTYDPDAAGAADPAQLLLWLYRRTPDPERFVVPAEDDPLVRRFRAFTSTDAPPGG